MTKEKQHKIKKLKTKRIWPSLIGFTISVILLTVFVMLITSLALLYAIEFRYSSKIEAAQYIAESIQNEYTNNGSFDDVLSKIHKDACIIDEDYNIVAKNCETDISLDEEIELGFNESKIFFSEEQKNVDWIDEDGVVNTDPFTLSRKVFSAEAQTDEWIEDSLYEIECWMVVPTDMDEYGLLVKEDIRILRKDLLYVCIISYMTLALVLIPLTIMLIDVISSVNMQKRMKKLLYLDETTGGNNWSYFKDMGKKVLIKRRNRKKSFAIVDFELMKYRSMCVCSGVEEGERVLEKINDMICANIAKRDICARYSRANYALLIECSDATDAKARIERLMALLANVAGRYRVVFHAGYYMVNALTDSDNKKARLSIDVPEIYNRASAARSSISNVEGNEIAIFTEKLLEDQLWEHKVESTMQAAIDNREFAVYYQPKYDPVTEELAGAEALIRWVKDDGLVPPGKFIPIFEKNGFITKIDDYMIENVARQQAEWLKEGKKIVPVSVNVSRAHFTQEDLAEHILEIVDRYEIPHKYIEIELTESAFFDDKNALLKTVNRLKEYGFEISMDDFGAGYSSLNSLKDLPLDVLKLDAEFFRGEDHNKRAELVVSEAITLAKQLEMRIVAEGIEKKNQVQFLADAGCDMIQGYYFAKPMPANDYVERMGKNASAFM